MTFIFRILSRSDCEVYEKGEATLCDTYYLCPGHRPGHKS